MVADPSERTWLDIESHEKEEAKEASDHRVRWDPTERRWWIATVNLPAYRSRIAKWMLPHLDVVPGEPMTEIEVQSIDYQCWRCGKVSNTVVQWQTDENRFEARSGDELRLAVAALASLDPEDIESYESLAHSQRCWSNTAQTVYFANCCRSCRALFGENPLRQAVKERTEAGDEPMTIAWVEIPVRCIQSTLAHTVEQVG